MKKPQNYKNVIVVSNPEEWEYYTIFQSTLG